MSYEYNGVEVRTDWTAYCHHCRKKIFAMGNDGIDDEVHKHINTFDHRENYYEFMEYNHNIVAYING